MPRPAPPLSALDTGPEVSLGELAPPRPDELLVVVGPTASGKTALAIELAERFGGEVVSADSVQIYTYFDAGSGKPTPAELARAPHHLVSELHPTDEVDASRFAELAEERLRQVRARGRVPIVCGGTFLWVKALVWGLAPLPPASPEARARHQALVASEGPHALHARLREVDPAAAERLAINDVVRVSRALEVWELTGRPQTEVHAQHGFRAPRHAARLLTPAVPRADVEQRLAARVDRFLEAGLVNEVRHLLEAGHGRARAMGSVGYAEARQHVEGVLSEAELAPAIVKATRTLVRRQRTWLRDLPLVRVRTEGATR